jgi:hypothetical protein
LAGSPNFVFEFCRWIRIIEKCWWYFYFFSESRRQFCSIKVTLTKHSNLQRRYLLNSNGGTWRLCGATMATVAENGFGPLYLTCGESGEESRTHV